MHLSRILLEQEREATAYVTQNQLSVTFSCLKCFVVLKLVSFDRRRWRHLTILITQQTLQQNDKNLLLIHMLINSWLLNKNNLYIY
jgi:hypothetical protein